MNSIRIDGELLVGAVICLGSCIFTCNFVLLGTSVPTTESSLWEILIYFAKLVGGISIAAAQILGLKRYKLTGEQFMLWLYRSAMATSIFMSVCAFHSMIQTGAVNVGRLISVDNAIEVKRDHIIKSLSILNKQRERSLAVFSQDTDKLDRQIEKYESQLDVITNRTLNFNDVATAKDQVSVESTYKSIAADFIAFWNLGESVSARIELFLRYAMLFAMAAIMDFTGTRLVARSFERYEAGQACGSFPVQLCHAFSPGAEWLVNSEQYGPVKLKFVQNLYTENDTETEPYSGANTGAGAGAHKSDNATAGKPESVNVDKLDQDEKRDLSPGADIESQASPDIDPAAKLAELGIDQKLQNKILEASKVSDSRNTIQSTVWKTGKSSRRGKKVNAVLEAYGITDLPWNENGTRSSLPNNVKDAA